MNDAAALLSLRKSLSGALFRAFSPKAENCLSPPSGEHLRRLLGRASVQGRCVYMLTRYPAASTICALLNEGIAPHAGARRMTPGEARRVALEMAARRQRNSVLKETASGSSIDALAPLIQRAGEDILAQQAAMARGAIIFFAHMGPTFGVSTGLGQLGVPGLFLTNAPPRMRFSAGIEVWSTKSNTGATPLFLKRGVEFLTKGHSVALAVDGRWGGSGVDCAMLGRRVAFRRGIDVLRALTGAPVVAAQATWTSDHGIAFRLGPKLPEQSGELSREQRSADTMERLVRWLETYIRERPEDLAISRLHKLTQAPFWGEGSHGPEAGL